MWRYHSTMSFIDRHLYNEDTLGIAWAYPLLHLGDWVFTKLGFDVHSTDYLTRPYHPKGKESRERLIASFVEGYEMEVNATKEILAAGSFLQQGIIIITIVLMISSS